MPDVPTSSVFIDPSFPSHIYVGNDIGVFVSTDGGASWHNFRTGLPEVVSVHDLTISMSNRKLRAATHGNGVYQIKLLEAPIHVDVIEIESITDVQVFPNPSSDVFQVRYNNKKKQYVEIRVLNSIGNVISVENQEQLSGNYIIQVNLKGKPKGSYLLKIKTADGVINKKLILQ